MSDVAAIRSAMAEDAHLVDDGHVEEWADLFLDEGELDADGRVIHGRAAMIAYLRAEGSFGDTTHVVSAPNIRVTGDEVVGVAAVSRGQTRRTGVGRRAGARRMGSLS